MAGSVPAPEFQSATGAGAGAKAGPDMSLGILVSSMLGMGYDVVTDASGINVNVFDNKITPPTFAGPTGLANPKKMTIAQAFNEIAGMGEDDLIGWKNELYDAGLYAPTMYANKMRPRQIGVITDEDRSAFQSLFYTGLSTPGPTTAQEIIMKMKKDNPYSKEKGYGVDKGVTKGTISDPATIRGYAKAAATTLLGRKLSDEALNDLIQKMSSQESGAITAQAQAEQVTDEGVIISQNVDVAQRAEQSIEAANPAEVEAKRVTNGFDVFMRMMTGG